MRYLIMLGVLALSLPFWLPTSLGGQTSYHFVLTNSMQGSVDAGSFVILRRTDIYRIGDVVGYRQDIGENSITILHRIVGLLPDGRYILKGDAVPSQEQVEEEAMTGRMILALPGLGFLSGAFKRAPLLVGLPLLSLFLLDSGKGKNSSARAKRVTSRQVV